MPYLVFQFPTNVDARTAIRAVADHFGGDVHDDVTGNGVTVKFFGEQPGMIPAHIKQAVENTAAALGGQEMSPAIAFGGLMNGAAGNDPATAAHVPSSAAVAPSTIAPVVSPVTSATTPPASSAPALPPANGAVAPVASAGTMNPANNGVEFDSSGLAWDERIHSGNKTKTPGGEWRTRKGTDKNLVKTVEAELRARYGNAVASAPVATESNTSAVASVDPAAKRAAALEYAHAEALRVAGPALIDGAVLDALNNGKSITLSPEQNDWYAIYYAKRNNAFTEYMKRDDWITPGNVAYTPSAPAESTTAKSADTSVASVPASPSVSAVGELDAAGLPHDPRINIGAKIKDAAGVWVQRFDVAPQAKLDVIAELRAAVAGNGAAVQSTDQNGAVGSQPVVPGVTAADASTNFPKFMQWIVGNQMAGRITPVDGPGVAKELGFVGADGNGQLALMSGEMAAPYLAYAVQMLQAKGAI